MKKIISLVITLSLVITMLASVTAFAANQTALANALVSEKSDLRVVNNSKLKHKVSGSSDDYSTTAIEDGSDVEVVNGDAATAGTTYRKLKIEDTVSDEDSSIKYTVWEFTLNAGNYTFNHNGKTNADFAKIDVYVCNHGGSSAYVAIDGSGAWKVGEDNKVHVVVSWEKGEIYGYVNGYMKQAIKKSDLDIVNKNTRYVLLQTKFGASTKPADSYALYTLKDYSVKNYSDFDPSWLDLKFMDYSYDSSTGKYTFEGNWRGYRNGGTLTSAGNTAFAKTELIFAVYNSDGSLSGYYNDFAGNSSGANYTKAIARTQGDVKVFFFQADSLTPLFSSKFFNAVPKAE